VKYRTAFLMDVFKFDCSEGRDYSYRSFVRLVSLWVEWNIDIELNF